MKQKKLMLLGGLRYLLPVIEQAHKLGAFVITADYLPDNIAHKYSDAYCNVSIIDKEAVLAAARDLEIDGILSHAVDPGVTSAAYVAEKMGLPFQCSYNAACILQNKAMFRQFLSDNGFNCPVSKGYSSVAEACNDAGRFRWPVMVKPVDSAGSKGVTRVDDPSELGTAVGIAMAASISGNIIVEEYLEKAGCSVGSESFVVDGKLLFNGFYDQHFDSDANNPFTPSAEIWPSLMAQVYQSEIKSELQRLFDLLGVTTGVFNVECRVCTDGKAYLMEVSPRGGGNRLDEMLNYASDVNVIEAEVRKALGMSVSGIHEPHYNGHFAIQVLHSGKSGIFDHIEIDPDFCEAHIIEQELRVSPGEQVHGFSGANNAIGTNFLKFNSREELERALRNTEEWMTICVR